MNNNHRLSFIIGERLRYYEIKRDYESASLANRLCTWYRFLQSLLWMLMQHKNNRWFLAYINNGCKQSRTKINQQVQIQLIQTFYTISFNKNRLNVENTSMDMFVRYQETPNDITKEYGNISALWLVITRLVITAVLF